MLLRGNRHGEELPRHLRPQKRQGRRSLGPRQQAPSRSPLRRRRFAQNSRRPLRRGN